MLRSSSLQSTPTIADIETLDPQEMIQSKAHKHAVMMKIARSEDAFNAYWERLIVTGNATRKKCFAVITGALEIRDQNMEKA